MPILFALPSILMPPPPANPCKGKAIAPRQEEEQENNFIPRDHNILLDDTLSEGI